MGMEKSIGPTAFSTFRGWNTKLSSISISVREATRIQNVQLTQETLQVRLGNSVLTTTQFQESGVPKPVTGIYQAVLGSTIFRVATAGSKIYSFTEAGVVTDITGAIVSTDGPDNLYSFAQFTDNAGNDVIIGSNGIDPPWKWTGTGNAALLTGVPANFKYLIVHKNRLWGTDGEFIYHSDLLDGETWDVLYWTQRFISKGTTTNEVTGVGKLGDNLVILKENFMALFSGESIPDGYVQDIIVADGCISGYSIRNIRSRRYGELLAFVNRKNEIKGFDGSKNLIPLSDSIDNTLNTYYQNRAKYVSAINTPDKEYVATMSTGISPTHNALIAYDYYIDGFDGDPEGKIPVESTMLYHKGINANVLSSITISGNDTVCYGSYDGFIYISGNYDKDVKAAAGIDVSPTGIVRASNVVTVTTVAPHEFVVGETVYVGSVTDTSFNGTFTIINTPTTTSFTYSQALSDATSGDGIAITKSKIESVWQSKRHAFGNAAFLKQLNDFNLVGVNSSVGQIKVTINTNSTSGTATKTMPVSGAVWGSNKWNTFIWGSVNVFYKLIEFEAGSESLLGRYFQVKIENVDGYRFGLEEYIMGITSHGYQPETVAV